MYVLTSNFQYTYLHRSPTKHAQLPPAVVTDGRHPLEWGDDVVTSSSESTSSHNGEIAPQLSKVVSFVERLLYCVLCREAIVLCPL